MGGTQPLGGRVRLDAAQRSAQADVTARALQVGTCIDVELHGGADGDASLGRRGHHAVQGQVQVHVVRVHDGADETHADEPPSPFEGLIAGEGGTHVGAEAREHADAQQGVEHVLPIVLD